MWVRWMKEAKRPEFDSVDLLLSITRIPYGQSPYLPVVRGAVMWAAANIRKVYC
jgi:hypothetical protein